MATEKSTLEGESSRIFVKGLPYNVTDADLRKHFSANGREITDLKLLPKRGIGFVGYKSPEDASKAVKYFNRTFMRLSKLSVELARPVSETWARKEQIPQRNGESDDNSSTLITDANPRKRKREGQERLEDSNPKLKEFLDVMQPTRSHGKETPEEDTPKVVPEHESDDEYESIAAPKPKSKKRKEAQAANQVEADVRLQNLPPKEIPPDESPTTDLLESRPLPVDTNATDDEWLRSRTSRVLDLMDVDEIAQSKMPQSAPSEGDAESQSEPDAEPIEAESPVTSAGANGAAAAAVKNTTDDRTKIDIAIEKIQRSSRLYVRNLPYSATESDLSKLFSRFGDLEQVHLPTDKSGASKGFAFVQYIESSHAVEAFQKLDATTFQGRNVHILPGEPKKDDGLDEFAISKLPLKKQNQIRQKADAAKKTFSWNSLYMSQDAVTTSVANRLGVAKSEVLDPTSADAAVKQAIAETSIIQETKAYFAANGVDLEAFKSRKRGDTSILVKNFAHGTTVAELRTMFEEYGTVVRVLMPPSGTIAIVQFAHGTQGKAAFQALAFRRFKDSILFLEKGPQDLFRGEPEAAAPKPLAEPTATGQKLSVTELLEGDDGSGEAVTSSLFVKNLSFDTTTVGLANAFKSLDGFVSAVVKTKTDPKKPGQVLSMGFGFVEFKSKGSAQTALKSMDGFQLDGHSLSVKATHKGHDAAEERRREDDAKKAAGQRTKIVIKNLPFEANKKDIYTLFGTYGKLRSVRLPKKFGSTTSRGFAFAEFVTPREAENALNALRDTHLLGRRLVLGYAEAEAVDAEEEIAKMQRKVGRQVSKVRLQQLTGGGRKKIDIGENNEDEFGG